MNDSRADVLQSAHSSASTAPTAWYDEIDGVRFVDRLTSYYNILLAFVWLILIPQWSTAIWLFLAHALAATIPMVLKRARGQLSRFGRVLRDLYPLIFILPFWTELDLVRRLLHDANFDRVVGALDLALFGIHLDTVFLPNLHALWFSEIMYFAYFAYYLTVILPVLYMAFRGGSEMKADITFRVVLIYLSCFFVYIAFPVDGPHWLTEHFQGDHQRGLFYQLEQALQSEGDALGCSFPSSHVAASTTMAYLGFRWFSKPTAWLLTLGAIGVMASTVYTQNHYAIDSVAGVIWAFWIQLMVAPALLRWWRCEQRRAEGSV